ncbi:putative sensor domain DACNV-containing protein [Larkinella sp. VNQ87]|uniref:putative sensor domain DACNV-containing protein n=1 Tax=Larkinella sp. VNQ87 TaxID=3400921 RepID=UPI003C062158
MYFKSTYQGARLVAETLETYFDHHFATATLNGEPDTAHQPHAAMIEAVIDSAFWASLQHEEGNSPKVSLALLPPDQVGSPLLFGHRLGLTPATLTKLAPAVERPGIHLGVWYENDALYIWGTTRDIPGNCFVLEVIEPGLLVIKHRRMDGFGKFVNVAILKGDQIKIIDEGTARTPDCPNVVSSMLGFTLPSFWNDSMNVLVQLAVSMRAHGRGGSLLVVPSGSQTWRESIIDPISYPVVPVFSQLRDLLRQEPEAVGPNVWRGSVNQAVDWIAGLTAVDGATIINDRYEVLGFGAKIGRSAVSDRVEQIIVTEPVVGNQAVVVHPAQTGGTRHLSAAQFVFDQRDAVALVASQDGRFTIFAWSPSDRMVHAHRVDALLL